MRSTCRTAAVVGTAGNDPKPSIRRNAIARRGEGGSPDAITVGGAASETTPTLSDYLWWPKFSPIRAHTG